MSSKTQVKIEASGTHTAENLQRFSAGQPAQTSAQPFGGSPSTRQVVLAGDDSITRTVSPVLSSEKILSPIAPMPEIRLENDLLELGVILDEFELIRYIGGGGMGNVWLAQDANLNRLVALKLLHRDKSTNPEVIQRFFAEAQVAALLNHPNISQVYVFRDHREIFRTFLAMEYVPGENLRERVKNSGPMKVKDTVLVALQISRALEHMAQRHVVHRDIKPSNILLTSTGEAKLIDFGLARVEAAAFMTSSDYSQVTPNDITASGVTLGTFDYISPEQARDPRIVDSRSDIYSLGCTLYYLLTGHPPFPQGNPLQKLLQHQSDKPMNVRLSRCDVPEALDLILTKAMQKFPEDRYSEPGEMTADLERVAAELGISVRTPLLSEISAIHPVSEFSWPILSFHFFLRQVAWLVPLLVFVFAVWFLQETWAPNQNELQLPYAPGTAPSASADSEMPRPLDGSTVPLSAGAGTASQRLSNTEFQNSVSSAQTGLPAPQTAQTPDAQSFSAVSESAAQTPYGMETAGANPYVSGEYPAAPPSAPSPANSQTVPLRESQPGTLPETEPVTAGASSAREKRSETGQTPEPNGNLPAALPVSPAIPSSILPAAESETQPARVSGSENAPALPNVPVPGNLPTQRNGHPLPPSGAEQEYSPIDELEPQDMKETLLEENLLLEETPGLPPIPNEN